MTLTGTEHAAVAAFGALDDAEQPSVFYAALFREWLDRDIAYALYPMEVWNYTPQQMAQAHCSRLPKPPPRASTKPKWRKRKR